MNTNPITNLIPAVKKAVFTGGTMPLLKKIIFTAGPGTDKNLAKRINTAFSLLMEENKSAAGIAIHAELSLQSNNLDEKRREEYRIILDKKRISLAAVSAEGLLRAAATLAQILVMNRRPPCCRISDWPDIGMRMFHLDLKTVPLDKKYIRKFIIMLAGMKINFLLMEYEDKFPFRHFPDIAVGSAYTPGELAELQSLCSLLGVEIIPLVQSYGHLEYILKHDRFRHLREDDLAINECCGTNDEAKKLILGMMEEVIAAHPGLHYFHIGGDEPFRARFCPRCRNIIDQYGKDELYSRHINPIIEFIRQKGLMPILWDDMIATHPGIAGKLKKPLILNYWNYLEKTDTASELLVRGIPGMIKTEEAQKKLSPSLYQMYEKYWKCPGFPRKGKTFSLTGFYHDQGYEVIGAGAARRSLGNPMDFRELSENMHWFSKRIREYGEKGILATSWAASNSLARPASHWEYYHLPHAAAAEHAWNGGRMPHANLAGRFCSLYYGISDTRTKKFFSAIVTPGPTLDNNLLNLAGQKPVRHSENFRLLLGYFKRKNLEADFIQSLLILKPAFTRFLKSDYRAIDISAAANRGYYNTAQVAGWTDQGDNDMKNFPWKRKNFGGIDFSLIQPESNNGRTIICMHNIAEKDGLPSAVEFIINACAGSIYFLHTYAKNQPPPDTLVGEYCVNFENDSSLKIPIKPGEQIDGWWGKNHPSDALAVWQGYNATTRSIGVPLHVYLYAWRNPHPGQKINKLILTASGSTSLLVLGITALKPGAQLNPEWKKFLKKFSAKAVSLKNTEAGYLKKLASVSAAQQVSGEEKAMQKRISLLGS
ncbi:MAG: hypothetical protein A2096_06850 [Spirochaetes bacterium GWF1_41_5]|nr:MAG: hypothetical protein A2096_06850 [Spirochaetes bacterium GWF1_41_5]HBE04024.1 hypothetical protein [Spirochaetia bacterium]